MGMDLKQRPFLSEEEFKQIREGDYAKFNEVMDRVFSRAVESSLLGFPEVAVSLMRNSMESQKMREEFFKENPDVIDNLPKFKEALAMVEEKEPALQHKDMLNKAAKLMREGMPTGECTAPMEIPKPSMGKLDSEPESVDEAFTGVLKHGK